MKISATHFIDTCRATTAAEHRCDRHVAFVGQLICDRQHFVRKIIAHVAATIEDHDRKTAIRRQVSRSVQVGEHLETIAAICQSLHDKRRIVDLFRVIISGSHELSDPGVGRVSRESDRSNLESRG